MRPSSIVLCLHACLLCAACTPADSVDADPSSSKTPVPRTARQAVTDPAGPDWFVAGGLYTDLVGADGEPDAPSGRYINDGAGALVTALNDVGMLVVAPDGTTTHLDAQGKPLRGDLRQVLPGLVATVAASGTFDVAGSMVQEFLVGAQGGRAQIVDQFAQPKTVEAQLFNAADVSAIAFSPITGQWLAGSSSGGLRGVNNTLGGSGAGFVDAEPIVGIAPNSQAGTDTFLAATPTGYSYYPTTSKQTLGGVNNISALGHEGSRVVFGTEDGRVAAFAFGAIGTPDWKPVLAGAPVRHIVSNGSGFVVLSDNGFAHRLDADGAPVGAPVQVGDGSRLAGAAWIDGGWVFASASSYAVRLNAELKSQSDDNRALEDNQVFSAAVSNTQAIVVGENGTYRIMQEDGTPVSGILTVPGGGDLRAISWNGESWLTAGVGGKAHLLNADGSVAQSLDVLNGEDVETVAWSGNTWLVAGATGLAQRVRPDGSLAEAQPRALEGFDHIHQATWNGRQWMVVGHDEGVGTLQLINGDLSAGAPLQRIEGAGAFYAVDWSGREWMAGGQGGLIQLVGSDGVARSTPAPMPRDVLGGQDIFAIDHHDGQFLIGGANGLTRRLSTRDLDIPAKPVILLNFADVRVIKWSSPRGFAGNACLDSTSCFSGPCIGNIFEGGFCCDAACDGPCESCLQVNTGVADGTCAPIAQGNRPTDNAACQQEQESTCGKTGFCDGQGQCELYGAATSCQPQSCVAGEISLEAFCDGQGACSAPATETCDPYVICEANECAQKCVSSNDCATGYQCSTGTCELIPEAPTPEEKDDEGCSTSPAGKPAPPVWLLGLLGWFGWRRRSRG